MCLSSWQINLTSFKHPIWLLHNEWFQGLRNIRFEGASPHIISEPFWPSITGPWTRIMVRLRDAQQAVKRRPQACVVCVMYEDCTRWVDAEWECLFQFLERWVSLYESLTAILAIYLVVDVQKERTHPYEYPQPKNRRRLPRTVIYQLLVQRTMLTWALLLGEMLKASLTYLVFPVLAADSARLSKTLLYQKKRRGGILPKSSIKFT